MCLRYYMIEWIIKRKMTLLIRIHKSFDIARFDMHGNRRNVNNTQIRSKIIYNNFRIFN